MTNEITTTITEPVTISANDQRLMLCGDPESTRYALGGVYFNCRIAAATDGRILAARFKSSTAENVVIGFDRPKQNSKKDEVVYHPVGTPIVFDANGANDPAVNLVSTDGKNAAHCINGRFPRWRDVPATHPGSVLIHIDAEMLHRLAKALTVDGDKPTVILEYYGPNDAIMVRSGRDNNGAGAIMPLTCEDGDQCERPSEVFKRLLALDPIEEPALTPDPQPEPEIDHEMIARKARYEASQQPVAMAEPPVEPTNATECTPELKPDRRVKHHVDWTAIAARYVQGERVVDIARSLGMGKTTVHGRLKSMGYIVGRPRADKASETGEPTVEPTSNPPGWDAIEADDPEPTSQPASETMAEPTDAKAYLDEPVNLGGVEMSRGQAIQEMRADGAPEVCIDRWLQGQELTTEEPKQPASDAELFATTAPKAYDGFSTKEINGNAGEDASGKQLRIVSIERCDQDWQLGRYGSGMHATSTLAEAKRFPYLYRFNPEGYGEPAAAEPDPAESLSDDAVIDMAMMFGAWSFMA